METVLKLADYTKAYADDTHVDRIYNEIIYPTLSQNKPLKINIDGVVKITHSFWDRLWSLAKRDQLLLSLSELASIDYGNNKIKNIINLLSTSDGVKTINIDTSFLNQLQTKWGRTKHGKKKRK